MSREKPAGKYLCPECGEITHVYDTYGEYGKVVRYRKCENGHTEKTIEVSYNGVQLGFPVDVSLPHSALNWV